MSSGLPSLYRRGTDIFGCKKSQPIPVTTNTVPINNLPPLPTVNDLLLLGRDEIAHMKDLKRSLRLIATKKSHQQCGSGSSSSSRMQHKKTAHPPTAPSYLEELLYGSDEDDENAANATNSETVIDDILDDSLDEVGSTSSSEIINDNDNTDEDDHNIHNTDGAESTNNADDRNDGNADADTNDDDNDDENVDEDDEEDDNDMDQGPIFTFQNFEENIDNGPTNRNTQPLVDIISSFQVIRSNELTLSATNQENRNRNNGENDNTLSDSSGNENAIFENALLSQSDTNIQIDDALSFVSSICRGTQESISSNDNTSSTTSSSNSSLSFNTTNTSTPSSRNSSRSRRETNAQEGVSSSRSRSRSSRVTMPDRSNQGQSNQQTTDGTHSASPSQRATPPNFDQNRNRNASSRPVLTISIPNQPNLEQQDQTIRHLQVHSPPTGSPASSGRRRRPVEPIENFS